VYTLNVIYDKIKKIYNPLLRYPAGRANTRVEIMNHKITMKQLPKTERPYEKCLNYGAQTLTDAELLAVILRTGSQGRTALELAQEILQISEIEQNLLGLHHLSINDLMQVKGIGTVKAVQIKCILELSRRIAKKTARDSLYFSQPQTIAEYYMEDFRHSGQEQVMLMMFNTKNKLVGEHLISKGTVNASLISPREIFIQAMHHHAVFLVLVHNHPSGDPKPSQEDLKITKRIQEAGFIIGITLLDHIIIGDKKYISLKEQGII